MFAASKTDSVSAAGPDAQFNYVTMLLHGDGTNGAQNSTFLDSSTNNFLITRNGNTTQGSFSPYGSSWSNFFPGTSGQSISAPANAALNLTGDFTIEMWCYANSFNATANILFHTSSTGTIGDPLTEAYVTGTGVLGFFSQGLFTLTTAAGAVPLNTWTHVAFTRSGSAINIWVNGVSAASFANSSALTSGYPWHIGDRMPGAGSLNYPWRGYLSNFRIVKGTAVYTATFTPPTTPLTAISGTSLLTCQSNRFVDNSTNNFSLTVNNASDAVQRFSPFGTSTAYSTATIGGSGYFDGTGDYLTLADSNAFNLSSSNFTVECWVYLNSSINQYFFGQIQSAASNRSFLLGIISTQIYFEVRSLETPYSISAASPVVLNQWIHLAAVRNGNTLTLYQNGVSIGTVDVSGVTVNNSTNLMGVGCGGGYVIEPLVGYITNARLVVGTAVYTANFTPPTAPLTAITNTQLLCNMTNGAIFDNAMMNNLETVGNAQISTSVVKYGTGSLAFDGSGDYLFIPQTGNPQNTNWELLSGDLTIEFWFYANTISPTTQGLVAKFNGNALSRTDIQYFIGLSSGGNLFCNLYQSTTNNDITFTSAISTGTWYHVALVRSGTSVSAFLNGVKNATTRTISGNLNSGLSWPLSIGRYGEGGISYDFNGYIDDLRITKGFARYTANFTPPTEAFQNTGPY